MVLSAELTKLLRYYLHEHRPGYHIVSSRSKKQLSPRRIEQLFKVYTEKSGIKITPRSLRRLCLVRIMARYDNKTARKITGLRIKAPETVAVQNISGLQNLKSRDALIMRILYETGCRISELSGLKWRDFKGGALRIGSRKISLSGDLADFLVEHRTKAADFITGRRISDRRIQQILQEYSRQSGIKITARTIRNTYMINEYRKGKGIEQLKQEMDLQNINIFTHGLI